MFSFFFFNDTATTEIYTLSLHDALPICRLFFREEREQLLDQVVGTLLSDPMAAALDHRSEEHTSELQSHLNLVCRLLLEKKKTESRTERACTWCMVHSQSLSGWLPTITR